MLNSFICQYCGKSFKAEKANRQFCSRQCVSQSRIKAFSKFICKYCGKPFEREVNATKLKQCTFEFCSPTCRNKARERIALIPCPVCGKLLKPKAAEHGIRRKYCSKGCANIGRRGQPSPKRTMQEIRQTIKDLYPTQGAQPLAEMFGLTIGAIRELAYKEGITLNHDVYYAHVHGAARKHMQTNNPMHNPESVEKVKAYYREHPDEHDRTIAALMEGNRRLQKSKPTKLELRLFEYLKQLGVNFESYYLIKPKFIVDAKVGNIIIQADGDYWHGHPRFGQLTDRQIAQQKRDKAQDAYLTKCGYTVIRIWESDMSKETVANHLANHDMLGG